MEAVLFDLDGTLLDTSKGILDSFFYVIEKLGYPQVSQYEVKAMIGTPVQKWFEKLYGVSSDEAQYAAELLREHNLKYSKTNTIVYPGVYEVFEELVKKDIKIAVATYKREDCALSLLQYFGMSKYCNSIRGADNCNKLKKVDIINMCLEEMTVNRENTIFVGDTSLDAQSAFDAGIQFIGVTYGIGFNSSEEIKKYPHLGVVDNIKDIISFCSSL